MEELIIKYFTDKLTEEEAVLFKNKLLGDREFRELYEQYLATISLVDYSFPERQEAKQVAKIEKSETN